MRIDFSRLQKHEISPNIVKDVFSSSFSNLWKHQQHKKNDKNITQPQQSQQHAFSFSVAYPFEINRSLSPTSFNQYFAYLEAKKELPTNTIKFIKSNLNSEIQKQASIKNIEHDKKVQPSKRLLNLKPTQIQQKNSQKPIDSINKINNVGNAQTQLNDYIYKKKNKIAVQAKVYDIKKNAMRQQKYRRKQQQLDGVTLKPTLNYTMNSRTAKKVNKKRSIYFKTCHMNVFESLYHDASLYATKRQMERVIVEEQSRCISRKSSRVQVNTTFEERLQTSIEKQALRKKMAQNKLEFDPSTGKKFFIPDTKQSKKSFSTHFRPHKISISHPQQSIYPARDINYSKDSSKLNHSQEITTINNSFEKDLNKSLDSKYKIVRKPLQKENNLAQLYAQLLWSEQNLKDEVLNAKEKKVLHKFITEIHKYEHSYSKNINKQVFIAVFKDFYSGLNLFDKAILDDRLKQLKLAFKEQTRKKDSEKSKRYHQNTMTDRKKSISSMNLYHTERQYYI